MLGVIGLTVSGACGDDRSGVAAGGVWAERAERFFLGMAESFCCEADYEATAYFAGSGSLDLRMVGGSIATTAEEMATELEWYLTAPDGTRSEVRLDDLYLSADGAIAVYRSILRGEPVRAWSALYAVEGTKVAGRLYSHESTVIPLGWNPPCRKAARS